MLTRLWLIMIIVYTSDTLTNKPWSHLFSRTPLGSHSVTCGGSWGRSSGRAGASPVSTPPRSSACSIIFMQHKRLILQLNQGPFLTCPPAGVQMIASTEKTRFCRSTVQGLRYLQVYMFSSQ